MAEHFAGKPERFESDRVTVLCSGRHHHGIEILVSDVAQFARGRIFCKQGIYCTFDTGSGDVCFEAPPPAATAFTAVSVDANMSEFAGKAVMAVYEFAV